MVGTEKLSPPRICNHIIYITDLTGVIIYDASDVIHVKYYHAEPAPLGFGDFFIILALSFVW